MSDDVTPPRPPEPAAPVPAPMALLPGVPMAMAHALPGVAAPAALERVGRGIALAAVAIPAGTLTSALLWKAGFMASMSGFVVAGAALFLYVKGAGATPRRGFVPLTGLIVLGVVLSFFACIAVDLSDYYTANAPAGAISRLRFIANNVFAGDIVSLYRSDALMFLLFGALGIFGTMRRIFAARRAWLAGLIAAGVPPEPSSAAAAALLPGSYIR